MRTLVKVIHGLAVNFGFLPRPGEPDPKDPEMPTRGYRHGEWWVSFGVVGEDSWPRMGFVPILRHDWTTDLHSRRPLLTCGGPAFGNLAVLDDVLLELPTLGDHFTRREFVSFLKARGFVKVPWASGEAE